MLPGPDQVLVEVAGDVAHHPSHDPAAAPRATAREAEAVQHVTARGVEAVTTRDQGLAPLPVTAGRYFHFYDFELRLYLNLHVQEQIKVRRPRQEESEGGLKEQVSGEGGQEPGQVGLSGWIGLLSG